MTTPMERLLIHPMTHELFRAADAYADRLIACAMLAHEARSRHGRKKQDVRWAIQARVDNRARHRARKRGI